MNVLLSLYDLESFDSRAPRGHRERRFCCPICGNSKPKDSQHRSLAVNTNTGVWICHRCSATGLLQEWRTENSTYSSKSARELARQTIKEKFKLKPVITSQPLHSDHENLVKLQTRYREFRGAFATSPASRYLFNRGISEAEAIAAGCGYAAAWEHWEKNNSQWLLKGTDRRVVFPVKNRSGDLVAISSRAIDENYLGAKVITKGQKSLGVFVTTDALVNEEIVITEAPIDALSLSSIGLPAIAILGTSWANWLPRQCAFRRVFLALDADDAGDETSKKLTIELAKMGSVCSRLRPKDSKDWNEMLVKNGAALLKKQLLVMLKSQLCS